MIGRTHAAFGLALGMATADLLRQPVIAAVGLAVVCEVASLAPDIDLRLGIPHRTITHSLLALLVVSLLAFRASDGIGLMVLIGYASHLVLDGFTRMGIPLFWPVMTHLRWGRIRTGGPVDAILGALALLAGLGAFYLLVRSSGVMILDDGTLRRLLDVLKGQ